MQCPRCQHDNPGGVKFCGECGARLETLCPACHAGNPPANKFCHGCGQPLTPSAPAAKFTSPETYTPKHLAEKILTSKSALEGERKQVTVLFADLKGSMELLADRDPEEARKLLDPVLERMMEAVHRYEGTVNQVMGDGIMALFGAPLAHEDHAVRACYAALDMQAAIRRYAEEIRRFHGISLEIRVGLNSGEVVVRAIGSDLHMDYTAVGQTTHLAARMEQLATGGRSLLTADTLRLAEGYVEVKPLGPVPVKGLEAPVEVYELVGAGPLRSRLHAAAARGLTRFVGREAELEQLRQALGRAATGHGQVVAIVGEPGVGKSRLVWEVTHSHRTHGWLTVQASSVSYGKATPYLPVIDLLKAYFKVQGRDEHREIREKVSGKLITLDESLVPTLPIFLALLDVPVDDPQWQRLDPPQRRQRTLEAVKRLLLRESQVQPLLVVFEDLHWIDSETQALLDSVVESAPTVRLLVLVNYRPEYQHGWGSKTYYTQLRLDPLPPESAGALLQALLGDDPALNPLTRHLIQRTEGNPFFLEESVRTLAETGVLVGDRGAYRVAKPAETVQMPATVHAMLAARIDRLPPEEKRLLQTASVIGKDVPFPLLQAISELVEDPLRRGLTHLQAAEFLYEVSLFPELEYTFKHALTHEVAYGSLLQERRRGLHGRLLDVIERLYADRLAEHVERLAHHAFHGEAWDRAVVYLRQAGAKAAGRSAHAEAVAYLAQALAALGHLAETRERLEQAVDVRFELRTSLLPLGELERILRYLQEAEALARRLEDQGRLGRLATYVTNYFFMTGDQERALDYGRRALGIAARLGDFALQAETHLRMGQVHHVLGDYRQAAEVLRRSVASLPDALTHERFGLPNLFSVGARNWLVRSLAELGEFADGLTRGDEALRIAEAVDQPIDLIVAAQGLGFLYLRKGELPRAVAILERGLDLCREWKIPVWFPEIAAPLGLAYALGGRLTEAVPLLEQAVEKDAAMKRLGGHSLWVAWLSEGQLLAGRPEIALGLAERALALARAHRERGHEAWTLRVVGDLASRRAEDAAADEAYRRGLVIADELGMRPLTAHCHLGLGKLYGRTGDQAGAKEHLTTATTMYREMDMGFWLAQAEAALRS